MEQKMYLMYLSTLMYLMYLGVIQEMKELNLYWKNILYLRKQLIVNK